MQKRAKTFALKRILLIGLCLLLFVAAIATGTYAYYKTDLRANGYANVEINLLFDMLDDDALTEYQNRLTANGETLTEADREWGHKGNPYVIRLPRHLQNLSTLQNIGYFEAMFLDSNYDDNGALVGNGDYSDGYNVPYFLVSDLDGSPTVVDGTAVTIAPVGNEKYPFVGVISGVSDTAAPVSFAASSGAAGKTTSTSAIDGVTVSASSAVIDHGLFGTIGCLGEEPDSTAGETSFDGFVSVVSDLLISDVQIVVREPSVFEILLDHLFNFSGLSDTDAAQVPHENHHIGILAGHVEYARFENISIYYSSDAIAAIDLSDVSTDASGTPANYSSSTGIFGFLYNLNPTVTEEGDIVVGSGTDNSDISYGYQGGGGALSGTNPGYILAEELYNTYCYSLVNGGIVQNTDSDFHIYSAMDAEGNNLCVEWVQDILWWENRTGRYYFTDGVFTMALSNNPTQDRFTDIWPEEEGNSTVPTFVLGEDDNAAWDVGQLANRFEYYTELTPVTNTSFSSDKDYAITWESGGVLYFMNLGQEGDSVPAATLSGNRTVLENGGYRYTYPNALSRNEINGYMVSLSASGNTYTITHQVTQNKLGVRQWIWKYIYCGQEESTSVVSSQYYYNWRLSYQNSSWQFSNNQGSGGRRYITASASDFNISDNSDDAAQLYIFEVTKGATPLSGEDAPQGYVPNDPVYSRPTEEGNEEFTADKFVLWPTAELTQTANANGETAQNRKTETPSYNLMSLSELDEGKGWNDSTGQPITQVSKMFSLAEGIDWALALDIFGLEFGTGNNAMVEAPIGSDGTTTKIPTGCIAFKINSVPEGGAKIRFIVALPTGSSPDSLGLDHGTLGTTESDSGHYENEDYYFGVWKGRARGEEDNILGLISWNGFNIDDAVIKVELPRSQPKMADGYPYTYPEEYIVVNIDTDGDGVAETYRTYLQGDVYLLAYEFTVNETGVYIMGATNSAMQIVYFSADGVASAGRDGTGGTQIGNVDYVYDYNDKVVLVTDTDPRDTSADGYAEDYQYYYQSYMIVYFDNGVTVNGESGTFVNINDERLCIRRWVNSRAEGEVKSTLNVAVQSAADVDNLYVKADGYARTCDILVYTYSRRQE